MSRVRVCFLGTPGFAVTCLQALYADEHYDIVGVVTQPDRPAGRKMMLTPSPVKSWAFAKGIKVISPDSIRQDLILEEIGRWGAEIAVVVAFGQIVPQKFLDMFQFGAVNVHASLLPRWRGAAPIQRAIQAGDIETGVSLQKMVKELDAGDVLGVRRLPLTPDMDARQVHDELARLSAELLHIEMMDYIRGNLAPTPQDPGQVTYAKKIDKSEGELDWKQTAEALHNKIRAFVMGPGTWTVVNGKKLKIHRSDFISDKAKQPPGHVEGIEKDAILIATGQGVLKVLELQPESRNRMSAADYLKAHPQTIGQPLK